MIRYWGDWPLNSTIRFYFGTFDASGGSITISGLAVTDIEIYKNGSVTQRSSDSGYALLDTDGIDFDGITGIHGFSVDSSDNTDAGFFVQGGQYMLAVSAITVDGETVSFGYNFTIDIHNLAATINAQVLDVLNTDTFAEPGQGAPAATTTLVSKIGYLYKAWRNKSTQTSTQYTLYGDDGSTTDQKSTDSDDDVTFTKGEVGTGA